MTLHHYTNVAHLCLAKAVVHSTCMQCSAPVLALELAGGVSLCSVSGVHPGNIRALQGARVSLLLGLPSATGELNVFLGKRNTTFLSSCFCLSLEVSTKNRLLVVHRAASDAHLVHTVPQHPSLI